MVAIYKVPVAKGKKSPTLSEVEESKFVQEMYVPRVEISHYDNDVACEIARHIKEHFKLSSSLIKVYNCYVVDGVVQEKEPLKWER